MQALTAEFFGFAEKFRCSCREEFKDSLFSTPLFQNRLMNRRAASIHEPAISAALRISSDFCGLAFLPPKGGNTTAQGFNPGYPRSRNAP